jgi:hypothetical protein
MGKPQPLNDDDRADLVAYLDGELDARSARAVEARLNTDPLARAEATTLQQTWELLDLLPRPAPSTAFTSRTLQSVSSLRPATQPGKRSSWRPSAHGVGWAATVVVAAAAGFIIVNRFYERQTASSTDAKTELGTPKPWIEQLPRAQREELQKLETEPAQYQARIEQLQKEQRDFEHEWQVAIRNWDQAAQQQQQAIVRLQALRPEIEAYIDETLIPMLNPQERNRLQRVRENMVSKGQWAPFAKTLVNLSDHHPVKLPGPSTGPTRFEQLPAAVQKLLPELKPPGPRFAERLHEVEGKWPDYAIAVRQFANRRSRAIPPLGPTRPSEFALAVGEFIHRRLIPVLGKEEKERLQGALGQWPQYPRAVMNLSGAHGLQVPLMGLPGPRELWDTFRDKPVATADAKPAASAESGRK